MLAPATYAALRNKVREALLLGQQRVEEAKVLTYWETGQLIDQHIRDHTPEGKERAAYNTRVVEKLAGDLKISDTVLYRCVRFAQQFKKVAARPLSWAHYRALITVPDEKERLRLADQAAKGDWSSRDLEIEIRNLLWDERTEKADGRAPSLLDLPALGALWTYQVLDPGTADGKLLLDLGFSCSRHLDAVTSKTFKPGDIVTSAKDAKGKYSLVPYGVRSTAEANARDAAKHQGQVPASESGPVPLYTYKAQVERVVDGDTLKAVIDIGFDTTTRQTLRLRGIDCPEMDTPEGKAAKSFVEQKLKGAEFITIKSIQSRKEKWGRYLADVFLPRHPERPLKGCSASEGSQTGKQVYLNNLLLEKGHAVRVRE